MKRSFEVPVRGGRAISPASLLRRTAVGVALAVSSACSIAAPANAAPAAQTPSAGSSDLAWRSLSPAQRSALQPLEREWSGLDHARRQKWLEIADRFPSLTPEDRARSQERMTQWVQLSPEDRGKARFLFQQAKQVSPTDRASKWEAYQALPEEEKRQLVERASKAGASRPAAGRTDSVRAARGVDLPPAVNGAPPAGRSASKSNVVPNPALAAPPMPVSPTVTEAGPGATTSLISKRPEPPPHQQTGLPKIAATPVFVDQTTLQPRRGPQAAATRSATASAPVARP